ncbi:RNA polymerase sigma-70 factor, ECF subfamily [Chitinophaga sp. YR627]|uniref:RNA polymerase sigma factor n=1 Tax=Chitinophaga sp. YR627 TaxID=1881041 RepID=UPI0008F0A4E5|nr:sigma-70 family RNA polymerase sigma factor [Chitinophaga sp. YR627]SFO25614.1 RNA polymerase sigma-70 factor, ECF subfamily [Chitinophaga sp. YR627]
MPQEGQHTLWSAIRKGDETAFRQLFEECWEPLFTYASRITIDHSLAQDSVQSLFIHIWEKRDSLPDVTAILPYLRSALKNRLLNALRDEHVYQKHVDLFTQVIDTNSPSSAEPLHLKETEQQLLQSINRLPGKMKDVFYLHRIEDLSVAEIACKLGTSPQTIRNQISTAMQRLKAIVG